jgi:hypothetical protein
LGSVRNHGDTLSMCAMGDMSYMRAICAEPHQRHPSERYKQRTVSRVGTGL